MPCPASAAATPCRPAAARRGGRAARRRQRDFHGSFGPISEGFFVFSATGEGLEGG